LNTDASQLSTATTNGTILRLFNTTSGEQLLERRRGNSPCTVNWVNFDDENHCLALASDTKTIHLFKSDSSTQIGKGWLYDGADSFAQFYLSAQDTAAPACNFAVSHAGKLHVFCLGSRKYYCAAVREGQLQATHQVSLL
jgi:WD40 repeat protein